MVNFASRESMCWQRKRSLLPSNVSVLNVTFPWTLVKPRKNTSCWRCQMTHCSLFHCWDRRAKSKQWGKKITRDWLIVTRSPQISESLEQARLTANESWNENQQLKLYVFSYKTECNYMIFVFVNGRRYMTGQGQWMMCLSTSQSKGDKRWWGMMNHWRNRRYFIWWKEYVTSY